MKLNLITGAGAVLLVTLPLQSAEVTNRIALSGEYFNELSEIMRTNHPALQAAAGRVRAAGHEVNAVRTWADPELMLGGQFADEEMRADEGDITYGIRQPLPLFGKATAMRSAAGAAAAVAGAEADLRFQFLRRDLAAAAFRTALSERIVSAGAEDVAWLEALAATARARYTSGGGTQIDVLRVENDLARRREELTTNHRMLEHERFGLNRFLNRPFETPWPSLELPTLAPPIHYNRQVVALATRFEPKVQVYRKQIEAAQAGTEVARRNYQPEVSVGVEARNYSGNGDFRQGMLTIGVSLPWLNRSKYSSDVARAESLREAVERELTDRELATGQEVHDLVVRIDAARRRALLNRDEIIPRTHAMLDSAYAAWVAGAGMTRDLLEVRRMLVEAHLEYSRAVAAQYEAMAELILCCGLGDLESLEMIGAKPDAAVLHHESSSTEPKP